MTSSRFDKADLYDPLELGERVSDWLISENSGSLYEKLEDRVWNIVVLCYRSVLQYAPKEAGKWYPQIDEDGRWTMP